MLPKNPRHCCRGESSATRTFFCKQSQVGPSAFDLGDAVILCPLRPDYEQLLQYSSPVDPVCNRKDKIASLVMNLFQRRSHFDFGDLALHPEKNDWQRSGLAAGAHVKLPRGTLCTFYSDRKTVWPLACNLTGMSAFAPADLYLDFKNIQ
jgi:hypothetical protein